MSAVLDASFLSGSLLRSQRVEGAAALLSAIQQRNESLHAPYLLQSEFVSVVRRLERRGRMTTTEAELTRQRFWRLPIEFVWDDRWIERALEISRAIDASTIYDSLYLACAEALDCQFYTCDAAFCRAFGDRLPARVSLVL